MTVQQNEPAGRHIGMGSKLVALAVAAGVAASALRLLPWALRTRVPGAFWPPADRA